MPESSIWINTLRPRQNGRYFADDIFKCIFLNENVWISIKISLKFVPRGPINNIPSLVQIMAWRRSGDKPLSETMMVSLTTHICVTRLQWVKMTSHERSGVSFHRFIGYLLNILSRLTTRQLPKHNHYCLFVLGLPTWVACNVESVQMSWSHHVSYKDRIVL